MARHVVVIQNEQLEIARDLREDSGAGNGQRGFDRGDYISIGNLVNDKIA